MDEIKNYIGKTPIPKILVSYDSFYKLLECIPDKTKFRVVVDEFQYLLQDASFKSEVGLALLNDLKSFPYVTYLSATPVLTELVNRIDYFKDIPYFELVWEDEDFHEVVEVKTSKPLSAALRIIKAYNEGNYPTLTLDTGEKVESTECVIYVNSVHNIVNFVKQENLPPEDVNMIVGSSEDNDKLIEKLGEGYSKGRIPLKGEKHKKFTFCTSTAFAGCDFYSECAATFVISDSYRQNTSINILTDLKQIAGRQRLTQNPFRKRIYFFYNTNIAETNEEEFLKQIYQKKITTEQEIDSNNKTGGYLRKYRIEVNKLLKDIDKYSRTYTLYDDKQEKFIFNELAYANEIHSYYVQKHNYKNNNIVFNQLKNADFKIVARHNWVEFDKKLQSMIKKETFEDKMRKYCELVGVDNIGAKASVHKMAKTNPQLKRYFDVLGGDRIRALNYKEKKLKNEIFNMFNYDKCYETLMKKIKLNEFISARDAKNIVAEAYKKNKITATPKGNDLSKWYEITEKKIRVNGIWTRGYVVTSKKTCEDYLHNL